MNYMNKSLLNSVGLSYGELSLKGKNRGQFERMLRNRIHKSLNGYNHQLVDDLSKLYVMVDNNDVDEVIEKLKKNKNYFIGITGSKSEKELPLNFPNDKNVIDFRGEINLVEFGALISKADIVVGNDSSPVHIASGFEKPFVIGIFGPGKRALGFFPWTEKSNVIEDNEFYENNIVIIPKNQHKYKKDYYKGISLISVDRVYNEIIKRIKKI